jgi:putative exosortase-associated protein (TIGR04073 family)
MGKKVFIMFVSILISASAVSAGSPVQKLERGFLNVLTAPVEIPKEIRAHWIAGSEKTYHIIVWIVSGFVKGSARTIVRVGSGLWDITTFSLNVPDEYGSVIHPEYVFDDWPQRREGVVYKNIGDQ